MEADRFLREGRYDGWEPELLLGRDISGSTVGLAGFGRVARATARRALGFGMRFRRRADEGTTWEAPLYCAHGGLVDVTAIVDVDALQVDWAQRL